MTRLEQLQQFVNEDPHDPFNLYALALEYAKSDPTSAGELFERLLWEHENYLPTYYQSALFFESAGNRERAIAVLEKGIVKAQQQNEIKTRRELQSVLDELTMEEG